MTKGVAPARNGILRPHLLRKRSLLKLTNGLITVFRMLGMVVTISPRIQFGAPMAYGVLGIGLVLLAMYAIAAGRSTTNPLHGAAYEEATLRQAKT